MARFICRSEDRMTPESSTTDNFVVDLKNIGGLHGRYTIRSVIIPNSLYNVTTTRYKIYINSTTVSITAGFYDGVGLASAIQAQLRTSLADGTFTCTYSTTTGKFTIARSTNFTLDWASSSYADGDDLARVLGWPNSNYSGASSYTAPNMANLISSRGYFINIQEARLREVKCSNGRSGSVCHIPIDQPFMSYVTWVPNSVNKQYVNLDHANQLSISVRDENGQQLSLNGVNWSIILQRECSDPSEDI